MNHVKIIEWLWAIVVAIALLVSFVYSNFSTKTEASDTRTSIERRLDRIEQKLDNVILTFKH